MNLKERDNGYMERFEERAGKGKTVILLQSQKLKAVIKIL